MTAQATPANIRNARRFLKVNGLVIPDTPETILEKALAAGWQAPSGSSIPEARKAPEAAQAPEQATPTTTPGQIETAITTAITAALASFKPETAPLDETAIVALIQKHSASSTLEVRNVDRKVTATIDSAHPMLKDTTAILAAGEKVYLYGPAGAGKTTLAKQAAQALSVPFHHTGQILQKYELTGFVDAKGQYQETGFFRAFTQGGLFLFDEIDASNPQAVVAFNQAIENREFTFPDGNVYTAHDDFYVIAAGNTNGQGATQTYKRNALDGATMDRFVSLAINYDEKLERKLAHARARAVNPDVSSTKVDLWVDVVQKARDKATQARLQCIIGPRSSAQGAVLIALGMTSEDAIARTFGARMSADQLKQCGL